MSVVTNDTISVDEFLAHHGILGMHWGKHKATTKPTNREVRNTAAYLRRGYDQDVAEKKAKGRIKAENILLGVGAVALTAAVGYAAYRAAGRHFVGVKIPMGTKVHHVNVAGPALEVQPKPMFVAFKKSDQKFYDSVFANFSKNRSKAENIYKSTLEATTDIRAPSNFKAKKLYAEFVKANPSYRGQTYSEFNYSFNGEGRASKLAKEAKSEFVKYMESKGYNAMVDHFDTVKSMRSRTNSPTILFDPTKSIKKVNDILLDNKKVEASALKYELLGYATRSATSPKAMIYSTMFGLGAFGTARGIEGPRERLVVKYKRQHPGTKLSDAAIYNLVAG